MTNNPMISEDLFLGGRVRLRQPMNGFRAAIDPVFLAAAIEAAPGERILELGAGTGLATLCLANRLSGLDHTGLDRQADLVELAVANAVLNGVGDRVRFFAGNLRDPHPELPSGGFDQVMANPPYLAAGHATLPDGEARRLAVGEQGLDFADWIRRAVTWVRPKGRITVVHRADRLDDVIAALKGRAGEIVVFPLWPKAGRPAGRVLVRARVGVRTPFRLAAGLILHRDDGSYTEEAQKILREGKGLCF